MREPLPEPESDQPLPSTLHVPIRLPIVEPEQLVRLVRLPPEQRPSWARNIPYYPEEDEDAAD